MNFENIIERRKVDEGLHSLVLEISVDEYKKDYEEYSDDIASNILQRHLENRGDDGRPSNVKIHHNNNHNIVRISANIHYLENDHTGYEFQ